MTIEPIETGESTLSEEPPRRIRSDGARTRIAILDAAAALATVDGIDGLSIGSLADHIGISKSGLFAHFRSKEALQLATVAHARAIFDADVVAPVLAVSEPGLETVEALMDRYLDHLERRVFPGGCFFASTLAEMRMRPGPVTSALVDFDATWLGLLRRHLALARDRGELRPDEDLEALLFEIESHALHAHLRFSARNDERALPRARAAIHRRLDEAALDA
jgi:AcrR family transcriptional regulator